MNDYNVKIKEIAKQILKEKVCLNFTDISRFTTGTGHSVFYVKTYDDKEYVLRITADEIVDHYKGSLYWLKKLDELDILVPQILANGTYKNVHYVLMSYINGKDLGDVYHTLNDNQKHSIAKEIVKIQNKLKKLPQAKGYGYACSVNDTKYSSWFEVIISIIERARGRIECNKVFNSSICDEVIEYSEKFRDYFNNINPITFLDDTTTKNVLINEEGAFVGIVDIDIVCFGDVLLTVGLTNMALLNMSLDTKYIDYLLKEMNVNDIQRKVVKYYTLLFCIDFMAEQNMSFINGNEVNANLEKTEQLKKIYNNLKKELENQK